MSFSTCPDCGDAAFDWCGDGEQDRWFIRIFMHARSNGRHFHRLVMR